jgi:hypothetical protein
MTVHFGFKNESSSNVFDASDNHKMPFRDLEILSEAQKTAAEAAVFCA